MFRIALALTFVLAASSAWADEMCPRAAQYQAHLALQQSGDDAAATETVATLGSVQSETGVATAGTAAVTE